MVFSEGEHAKILRAAKILVEEKIAHPIPEDVKGNYIEMEKKLKAEKRAAGKADEDEE